MNPIVPLTPADFLSYVATCESAERNFPPYWFGKLTWQGKPIAVLLKFYHHDLKAGGCALQQIGGAVSKGSWFKPEDFEWLVAVEIPQVVREIFRPF